MWREEFLRARRAELERVRALLRNPGGHVHLLGLGGVGVAAVALHLQHRGFRVSGCDLSPSAITSWLTQRGIEFRPGHGPDHITDDVQWVVRSAAVGLDDPEVARAIERKIPVFLRGVVLPALLDGQTSIAVSGTHGKTTTTAMIAHVLRACGRDVSFAVGAEADALGGVAGVGKDKTMVAEADESDGTVALYEPDYAVITNIEMDHVDFFQSLEDLEGCLTTFGKNARRAAVVCIDDPGARRLIPKLPRVIPYSIEDRRLDLGVTGRHNLQNAMAACAVVLDMGLPLAKIEAALKTFQPVKRRFERIAEARGIAIISDYAHHPTEIRALMQQAAGLHAKRLIAVFQPHRYSRTLALGHEYAPAFDGADEVVLVPVYAASEKAMPGGTSLDLMKNFDRAHYENSLADAWKYLRGVLRDGDALLVVGAGDVEKIAFWARDDLLRTP